MTIRIVRVSILVITPVVVISIAVATRAVGINVRDERIIRAGVFAVLKSVPIRIGDEASAGARSHLQRIVGAIIKAIENAVSIPIVIRYAASTRARRGLVWIIWAIVIAVRCAVFIGVCV